MPKKFDDEHESSNATSQEELGNISGGEPEQSPTSDKNDRSIAFTKIYIEIMW